MKLKQVDSKKLFILEKDMVSIVFSYETPIMMIFQDKIVMYRMWYSGTTTKHKNKILSMYSSLIPEYLSYNDFQEMLKIYS